MTEAQTQSKSRDPVVLNDAETRPNGAGKEVAVRGPSVIADMASRFGMDKRAFEATLRGTVFPPSGTNEEFAAFLLVARDYGLNPILREIFAFPKKGGGIQPIVGIDGWLTIINRHPQMDGMSFKDHVDESKLVAITCTIHRKDRQNPIEITEYLAECKRNTDPWNQMPSRMLRHKTTIQCARYAFGISGIQDPDEFERSQEMEQPAPPRPTREQFTEQRITHDAETGEVTEVEAEIVTEQTAQPEPVTFHLTDLDHNVTETEDVDDAHGFIVQQFKAAAKVSSQAVVGAWDANASTIGQIRTVKEALAQDIDEQFSVSVKAAVEKTKADAAAKAEVAKVEPEKKTAPPATAVPPPLSPLKMPKAQQARAWPTYAAWFTQQIYKMPAEGIDAFLADRVPEWRFIQDFRMPEADAINAIIDGKKNPPKDSCLSG